MSKLVKILPVVLLALHPLFAGENALNLLKKVFTLAYGKGILTYKGFKEQNCTVTFEKILYTVKDRKFKISTAIVPKLEKPLTWIYLRDEKFFKEGKLRATVGESYIVSTGNAVFVNEKNLVFLENFKEPILKSKNFSIDFLFSDRGFALNGKGFVEIPKLFRGKRFLSVSGFINLINANAVGALRIYLEDYFDAKIKLVFENVDLAVLKKVLNGDKKASEKFFDIVPKYLKLTILLEDEALNRLRANKKEIEREVKPHLQEKGFIGDFSRVLKAIAEGKATGISLEIENKLGLNISQLIGLAIILSTASNEKQIENILRQYLNIKISAI